MGVSLITGFIAKEVVVSSMGVLYYLGVDESETSETLISKLRSPESGITKAAAFAYMIFVLFYTPCIVAIIIVRREIGMRWMWFTVVFQLMVAWLASFAVYQIGSRLGF